MTSKLNYIVFSLCTLTGVAVRTAMLLFTVDQSSGFIKPEYATASTLMIIFLVFGAVTVFTSGLLLRTNKDAEPIISGKPLGIACIIMAGAMLYETFFSKLLLYSQPLQITLQYIFTLGASCSLVYIAYCIFTRKSFPSIISIAPVLFWTMRLIMIFSEFSTISTISDTVIETAGMCLALATFLFYAKIECRQSSKYHRLFFATSLTCGYVCAVSSIPRIIADSLYFNQSVHLNAVPTTTAFAAAIFSVIFAYLLLKEIKE